MDTVHTPTGRRVTKLEATSFGEGWLVEPVTRVASNWSPDTSEPIFFAPHSELSPIPEEAGMI